MGAVYSLLEEDDVLWQDSNTQQQVPEIVSYYASTNCHRSDMDCRYEDLAMYESIGKYINTSYSWK